MGSRLFDFISLTGDLVDGLGQALHVAACYTSNGYSAVLGCIHGVLNSLSTMRISCTILLTSFAN